MKKYGLFLLIILFITATASLQPVTAQDKTKEDKEKEYKMQQSIEKQKKAMADQKKAEAEQGDNENSELETEMDNAKEDMGNADRDRTKIYMNMARGNRSFNVDPPFVFAGGDGDMGGFWHMGESERTSWDFSKTVKDNTFARDYTFDVEKTTKSVVMSVMGDCKSGEIRIKIVMPNGKNYSDILIDESGNLNWRKSFTITETENKDKTGDWKFQISSAKATGFFKISLQAY